MENKFWISIEFSVYKTHLKKKNIYKHENLRTSKKHSAETLTYTHINKIKQ